MRKAETPGREGGREGERERVLRNQWCSWSNEVPVYPLVLWLAKKLRVNEIAVNLAAVKQPFKEDIAYEDLESMQKSVPPVLLWEVQLSMHDVLSVPPGWIMLERSGSLNVAGFTINWMAKFPGSQQNLVADSLGHLKALIPGGATSELKKLQAMLAFAQEKVSESDSAASAAHGIAVAAAS